MKKLVILSIALFVFASAKAQDHVEIAKTVNYYLEGGTNNDFETLKKAFHPEAKMTYLSNGEFKSVNAIEFFGKGMKGKSGKQDRQTRITNIDVSGHVASARLEILYPTFKFIDYMQLLKVDGEWKIISKTFFRESLKSKEG